MNCDIALLVIRAPTFLFDFTRPSDTIVVIRFRSPEMQKAQTPAPVHQGRRVLRLHLSRSQLLRPVRWFALGLPAANRMSCSVLSLTIGPAYLCEGPHNRSVGHSTSVSVASKTKLTTCSALSNHAPESIGLRSYLSDTLQALDRCSMTGSQASN